MNVTNLMALLRPVGLLDRDHILRLVEQGL